MSRVRKTLIACALLALIGAAATSAATRPRMQATTASRRRGAIRIRCMRSPLRNGRAAAATASDLGFQLDATLTGQRRQRTCPSGLFG